jgi:transcriptional regulator with GAF, ATPase, and Fis domain
LQAQLLRVIQEKTFKPVGSNVWQATDFRLVCATHRDLMEQVRRGEFRHDLYHRIATWPVRLPALRERPEDILPLARHLARHQSGAAALEFDEGVQRYLVTREYPGNVRELRHVVQRLADRHPGAGPITLGQVPEDERKALAAPAAQWPDDAFELAIRRALSHGVGLKRIGRIAEDLAVRFALSVEDGNVARASRRLGITDRALQLRQAAQRRDNLGEPEVTQSVGFESMARASTPAVG